MSSTNKTTNYNLSQFVGTDIPSILNDYNGDMQKIDTAVHNVSVASGDNASDIASLQSTVSGHTSQITQIDSNVTAVSGRVLTVEGKVTNIENVIPSKASASNKLATMEDVEESGSIEELETRVGIVETNIANLNDSVSDAETNITSIQNKIPSEASTNNKLTTSDHVDFNFQSFELHALKSFSIADYANVELLLKAVYEYVNTRKSTIGVEGLRFQVGTRTRYSSDIMSIVNENTTSYDISGKGIYGGSTGTMNVCTLKLDSSTGGSYDVYHYKFANNYYADSESYTDGTITGHTYSVINSDTATELSNGGFTVTVYTTAKSYNID